MRNGIPLLKGLALCALLWATPAQAQNPSGAYAIVGARIEIGDGRVLEKGVIVLRDGLIVAVGANITPPPDAEVIRGEGLTVYPGFIDACSQEGLTLPEGQPNQDAPPDSASVASPAMREANRKGVRPELRAAEFFALSEPRLLELRKNGFASQALMPSGGMILGQGVLVNLSGRPRRESVALKSVGIGFGFGSGGFGAYPGSLMGVFAHLRQTLLDAQRHALHLKIQDAPGVPRPPADEALDSLVPALNGTTPVFFEADTENAILRAIRLCGEFGMRPVINGGLNAFEQAPLLAQKKIPLLLSLNFGREPQAPRRPAPANPASPANAAAEDETPETPSAILEERKRLYEARVANAATLHRAGVTFALTTKGLRSLSEFWENLRRAIKAGLPREAALRALTLHAATLLGAEKRLGSIEVGKIASLTVMNGDFATAGTQVMHLFIDKEHFEPSKDAPPPSPMRPMRRRPTGHDDEDDPHAKENR